MNGGLSIKLLVEYSPIFGEQPKSLDHYLTGISRPRLLNVAAFFLGFSNRQSKFEDFKEFLSMFFCAENQKIAEELYNKLTALRRKYRTELTIINSQGSLQLFEYAFDNLTDVDTQTQAQAEVNIFKALLAINEQNTSKEKVAFQSTAHLADGTKPAGMTLAQTFPYSELVNFEITEVWAAQLIKSIYLFEFLESNAQTQELLKAFLKYFDCSNWKEFLLKILPIISSVIMAEREAHTDINVTKDKDFVKNCAFIDKLIVLDSEVVIDYDFKKLRAKPLYKISEGTYRIIFGLFIVELIHKGVFFKLAELNQLQPEATKIKNFRSFYCDEFSEKFLLYRVINSIYQNRYIEYSGIQIKQLGFEGEPDYYIRKGNALFLFESKDILINAEIKPTYDFRKYEEEFKKKLYFEEKKKGRIDKKAVLQLIDNIRRSLIKEFSFDTNYKVTSLYIYPILVLHDRQFNVAGLNLLINKWFAEELGKLKAEGLNIQKVMPITIIDIDTLIFHQDILRDRVIKLEDVLDGYFKTITFDFKKKYRDEQHAAECLKKTLMPFSVYMGNHVDRNKIRRVPRIILDKGMTLFT